jgi:hypothetical protein
MEHCFSCIRKHLGAAAVLIQEFITGEGQYDAHFWLAVGNMAEAERECGTEYLFFAIRIRKERTRMIEEDDYYPDFVALIDEATVLAEEEWNENKKEDGSAKKDDSKTIDPPVGKGS